MTEQYQIALDPELGIAPEAFVAAWNENGAALQAGRVGVSQATQSVFDPGVAALLLTAVSGVALGVLTNLISDIVIKASQPQKEPEIRQQTLADGSKVIIVTIRES
jgi:hypothetical protein